MTVTWPDCARQAIISRSKYFIRWHVADTDLVRPGDLKPSGRLHRERRFGHVDKNHRRFYYSSSVWKIVEPIGAPRRTNRRGQATRDAMLDAALRALATGDAGAASANRIAKDAGATWGAVKYQFGDIDGLWAAVLRRTAERRGLLPSVAQPRPLRCANVLPPSSICSSTGSARPTPVPSRHCVRRSPVTAPSWSGCIRRPRPNFSRGDAAGSSPVRRPSPTSTSTPNAFGRSPRSSPARCVASSPSASSVRYYDLDLARRGLTNAIVNYLQHSR